MTRSWGYDGSPSILVREVLGKIARMASGERGIAAVGKVHLEVVETELGAPVARSNCSYYITTDKSTILTS